MTRISRRLTALVAVLGMTLMFGCATKIKGPEVGMPHPTINFGEFTHFELVHTELNSAYADNPNNMIALQKVDRNMVVGMCKLIPEMTVVEEGELPSDAPWTLRVEPFIEEVKYIRWGQRLWSHMFAGKGAIVMRVRYVDAAKGEVIAEPWFYQHANAVQAGFVPGLSDNLMLNRVVWAISDYTGDNWK